MAVNKKGENMETVIVWNGCNIRIGKINEIHSRITLSNCNISALPGGYLIIPENYTPKFTDGTDLVNLNFKRL